MTDNPIVAVALFAVCSIDGQWSGTVTAPLHEIPLIEAKYRLLDRTTKVYPHASWSAGDRHREWDIADLSGEWERLVSAHGHVQAGDGETVLNLVSQIYGSRAELARAMRKMYHAYAEAVRAGEAITDGVLQRIARLCFPEEEELREIDTITAEDLALVRNESEPTPDHEVEAGAQGEGAPAGSGLDEADDGGPAEDHPLVAHIAEAWTGNLGPDAVAAAVALYRKRGAEVTPDQVMAAGIEGIGKSPPRAKAMANIIRDYALGGK
jgi:hypothetical protein